MKKAAIYARVSTDKQELENQLQDLRKYCQKSDYEIYKEYTDIVSGKKNNRPGFDSVFNDARKKKFDVLVFWDISRFSRSGTLFTLQRLKELGNLGIRWHSYQDPYFSSLGEFKDVVLSVMATIAKVERKKISERTKAGLRRAKKNGKKLGRPKKDPDVYTHYCAVNGCRVRVERSRSYCDKHRKSSQKKGGSE